MKSKGKKKQLSSLMFPFFRCLFVRITKGKQCNPFYFLFLPLPEASEATVSQREGKGNGLASFPFPSVATLWKMGCYARKWEGLSRKKVKQMEYDFLSLVDFRKKSRLEIFKRSSIEKLI